MRIEVVGPGELGLFPGSGTATVAVAGDLGVPSVERARAGGFL